MNKREYFSAVNEIVKKAIAARIEAQTALDGVEEKISNRRKYSMEHINKVLEPQRRDLRRQINDAADLAKIEVEKLTAAYIAELEAENHLNGGALTEDAQLLSVGVKLRDTDIEKSMHSLSKRDLEDMICAMRAAGLAHNSISTYVRVLRTFLNWCQKEGRANLTIPNMKDKETVKETYSDEELSLLLQKPNANCSFPEYRNWVIINFLLNSGCRAATVRNIQNRDVDLGARQIVYRHTKNGKVQTVPLCSKMVSILRDYMTIRKGEPAEYLFCDQYGECSQRTPYGLRLPIITVPVAFRKQASICSATPLPANIWLTAAVMRLCSKSSLGIPPLL